MKKTRNGTFGVPYMIQTILNSTMTMYTYNKERYGKEIEILTVKKDYLDK